MTKRHLNALMLTLAGSLLVPAAQAHETWLAKIHGQPTVMYGHEESATDPYNPATVTEARAYKNGKPAEVAIVRHNTARFATLKADAPGLLTAIKEDGFWTKAKDGTWHNLPKDQLPAGAEAERSMRAKSFPTAYLNKREPVKRLGYELEIVPAVNPATLAQGEQLTVQVFYKGKPLADAKVATNVFDKKAPKVTTDSEGRATFAVASDGFNVVRVANIVDYPNKSKSDKDVTLFTLAFNSNGGSDH